MLHQHCLPIIQPRFGIQFTRTSARLSYVLLLDVANFSACVRAVALKAPKEMKALKKKRPF